MSQRVPEFTAKYTLITDFSVDEPLNSNYETIFSYASTCSVEKLFLKFDSFDIDVQVYIDDLLTLDVNLKELYYFESGNDNAPLFYDNSNKMFSFLPSNPIQAKSGIIIKARATGGGWWGSEGTYKGHSISLQHWS